MKHDLEDIPQSDDPLDLRAASRDLWPGGTLRMWLGEDAPVPARVFWPETDEALARLLEQATAAGRVVIPYGAGSGVCGGARGRAGSWVVDTKRFDDIGSVDPETWIVEVGAGVIGQIFEDAIRAQGFTLGHSPSSIWCSTVGGWGAARGAGQFSSRYGVFEDMVMGLDAVAPGVGSFHVGLPGEGSPSHRGPDQWMPLLLGSEGTLAVITRLRLRVRPVPETRWLRGYRFATVEGALQAMRGLMQGELWPAVVRLYDPVDTLIGGKTRPKSDTPSHDAWWRSWLGAVDALPSVRKRTLSLPLALPGLVRGLADRLAGGCLVVVGWEGESGVVEAGAAAGHAWMCEHGEDLGEEPGQRWYASRHNVSYKLMPFFERGGFADTMEVAARWSQLPAVYNAVRNALSHTAVPMAHMSHVYPEGGSIYFSFAGPGDVGVYEATWAAALEAVLASGATVTHHHGVGMLKAAAVSREVGPAVTGWWAAKAELDPGRVLNPGRLFVDGDWPKPPPAAVSAGDGLVRCGPESTLKERQGAAAAAGGELRWPWEELPCPPRWQRSAWQTGWIEVRGNLGGVPCALGRGPRSASGPDLRGWLVERGEEVTVTTALAPAGGWMGSARVQHPWRVARDLLRADLRPGALGVQDGVLFVGFRGPAAEAYGRLAAERVPGGLEPCAWRALPMASGRLERCDPEDPAAVAATSELVLRHLEAP